MKRAAVGLGAGAVQKVGHGTAFGAVSVLNATATGIGCALAVAAGTEAGWEWLDGPFGAETPGADDHLARAVWQRLRGIAPFDGANVRTSSLFPPSRGLKTSSSAAGALVRAAFDAVDEEADWQRVAHEAVEASVAAGVTLTGAYDDQVAVLCGGAHLTDNRKRKVLQSIEVPAWHVAVWVPEMNITKPRVAALDAGALRPKLAPLADGLDAQKIPHAMTENGQAFLRFYAAYGLPVDDRPAKVALDAGALGAGLSGTGPAVAALFDRPADLANVPGGAWMWTRAVGVQP